MELSQKGILEAASGASPVHKGLFRQNQTIQLTRVECE